MPQTAIATFNLPSTRQVNPQYTGGARPVSPQSSGGTINIQAPPVPGIQLSGVRSVAPVQKAQNTTTAAKTTTVADGSSSDTDPVAAAYYADRVNSLKTLLGSLPTTQAQGEANIRGNATKSLGDLNTAESQTASAIAQSRKTANTNKATSLNGIDQNVANTVESFKRLLGASHAGDSAFANDFVPIATARQGSSQRQQVFDSFGRDMGGIDTAEKGATTAYEQNKRDINDKMNSDLLSFLTGTQNQQDDINNQIKEAEFYRTSAEGGTPEQLKSSIAPYTTNPRAAIDAMNALFAQFGNPSYAVNPVNVSLPDVSSYTQDPLVASLSGANPDTQTALLPYYPQLKKQTVR